MVFVRVKHGPVLNNAVLKVSSPLPIVILVILCWGGLHLQAQIDTLLLPELTIEGRDPTHFLPGVQHWTLPKDSLPAQSLSQSLSREFPWYFVEYGAPGQLSSANLRGLGSSRTSVLWQGMEINSFTLGQTDFGEVIPAQGYRVDVALGALSAVYGNGALGGTVSMGLEPNFNNGKKLRLHQQLGSYGRYGAEAAFQSSSKKLFSSTAINHQRSNNDFLYSYQGQEIRQPNAGYRNWGLSQDLFYNISSNHHVSGHFWFNDFMREIQPGKGDAQNQDQLENRSLRTLMQWTWDPVGWTQNVSAGYTRDEQIFNEGDPILVNRGFFSYQMLWNRNPQLQIKAGGQLNYLNALVEDYNGSISETRIDYYASTWWSPLPQLKAGLSIRLPQVSGDLKPLTPLMSMSYILGKNESRYWQLDGQVGRSYRVPTLNDRYWQPGGNLSLKPELSNNWETGISFDLRKAFWSYQGSARYYYHHVENWIIWIPGGRSETEDGQVLSFWFPENIREVVAQGMEFYHTLNYQKTGNPWKFSLRFQASYKSALNKKAISGLDRSLDKQLPYTPKWTVNSTGWIRYHNWSAGLQAQHQGSRFTEANNELLPLPAYTLWNLHFSRPGTWGSIGWRASFQLNNIWDQHYENFENRAMPGRNYNLSLILELKTYKSDYE